MSGNPEHRSFKAASFVTDWRGRLFYYRTDCFKTAIEAHLLSVACLRAWCPAVASSEPFAPPPSIACKEAGRTENSHAKTTSELAKTMLQAPSAIRSPPRSHLATRGCQRALPVLQMRS